jgi:hypothetical protein
VTNELPYVALDSELTVLDELVSIVDDPASTFEDFYRKLVRVFTESGQPSTEFIDTLQEMSDDLVEAGVDAFRYTGGKRVGKGHLHEAMVWLDSESVEVVQAGNIEGLFRGPTAGGVARETGEAAGRHDTPFVAAARTNPKLNRLETSLQEVEERLNDALSPEMDGLRWSYISDNELIDEVADELANDPEYQRTLQQVLSDVFGGTEKDPIVLYRGRIPDSDSGREYVAASAHPRWAAAFGQGGFDLRGIAGLPDGELVELTVPRGNIAFHGSAEEAELIVSLDENVIERVIESLPRIPGR